MILAVHDLVAYRGRVRVLNGLNLSVEKGEIVGILGRNGAGKSTLLGVLNGLFPATSGKIQLGGTSLVGMAPEETVRQGVALVPERRQIFPDLTVEENLKLGAYARANRRAALAEIDGIYELFPILKEKCRLAAGSLSGGQQQMVAVGRALMSGPRLLLLDEPSLGLAPVVVDDIGRTMQALRSRGVTMILVEQDIRLVTAVADRIGVMDQGKISLQTRAEFSNSSDLVQRYFGLAGAV